MLAAIFHTFDPSNHVPRILDTQHRMGIALHSLSVQKTGSGAFEVHIKVTADNEYAAHMFCLRITRMPGVTALQHEFISAPSRAQPRQVELVVQNFEGAER